MNKKDHLIEETLKSFEGIQKAEADPFLYEKVLNKVSTPLNLTNEKTEVKNFSWNYRWQLAALFLLLIINSFFLARSNSNTNSQSSNSAFANEYFGKGSSYNY